VVRVRVRVRFGFGALLVSAAAAGACGLSLSGSPSGDGGAAADADAPGPGTNDGTTSGGDATSGTPDATSEADAAHTRVTAGLLALFTFDEGSGAVAKDTSGLAPALNLDLPASGTSWVPGALRFSGPSLAKSGAAATRIATRCATTNEVTVEAWLRYAALPDWSRIVAMSTSNGIGNLALTSNAVTVGFDLRSTSDPYVRSTKDVFDGGPPTRIVHLVAARDAAGAKRMYLDGEVIIDATQTGTFSNWEATLPLSVGNTPAMDRPFYGDVHLVAIYDHAFTLPEVRQNFAAGPDP
jgi:hypothetical protein